MKYMGSKARHAKELLAIILESEGSSYVEPFVGGANMIERVPTRFNRMGSDVNPYLIATLQAASSGWMPPPQLSEVEYRDIQKNKDRNAALTGYAAFALSYGGKWFGGYRRDSIGKRNYAGESYRDAARQFPLLAGIEFVCSSYDRLMIPDRSIVYCDPPYASATSYKDKFDSRAFYDWCNRLAMQGHKIFVSEYAMPSEFTCVWEKSVTNSLTKNTGGKIGVERLFALI